MEVLDSKSIKQIQNFYSKSNLENKSTEVDEEKSANQKNREVVDNIQINAQDIASQSNLLKNNTENLQVEKEIAAIQKDAPKAEVKESITKLEITFKQDTTTSNAISNPFMLKKLKQKFSNIQDKHEALLKPVQIRRENLEDSLVLHQFNKDIQMIQCTTLKLHLTPAEALKIC